jgi:dTMP kinase
MFIVLEGPDFVGKTTQAALLADRLRGGHYDVLHLAFPSTSAFGAAARRCLKMPHDDTAFRAVLTQACMTADRYTAAGGIQAHLKRGGIVVSDRWTPSGLIYGEVDGLDPEWLAVSQASLPVPDLQILLWAPFATLLARGQERIVHDRYEDRVFARQVWEHYDRLRADKAWFVVDADRTQDQISASISGHVAAFLRKRGY